MELIIWFVQVLQLDLNYDDCFGVEYAGFSWAFGTVNRGADALREQCQNGDIPYAQEAQGLERFSWEVGYTPARLLK